LRHSYNHLEKPLSGGEALSNEKGKKFLYLKEEKEDYHHQRNVTIHQDVAHYVFIPETAGTRQNIQIISFSFSLIQM